MGKQWKQCQTLFFGGSKITADGDCNHEIKRRLLLGRKVMTNLSSFQFSCSVVSDSLRSHELQHSRPPCPTNLDSILKSRDITLSTKVRLVKARFFQWSCMDVRGGPQRKLSTEELMLLNYGVGGDSRESLGLQRDPASPS